MHGATKTSWTTLAVHPTAGTTQLSLGTSPSGWQVGDQLAVAGTDINDYTSDEAFLIPQSVISENAQGQQYLYVVEDKRSDTIGTTKRVIVSTGLAQEDHIEVLSGLEVGMEIIEEGARSVKENQEVEIINQ